MGKLYIAAFTKITTLAIAGFSLLFAFSSCKKNNLIPSYIHIDTVNLSTTYEFDGTKSHKITDVWVYIDDNLQGIYELPTTFPVLASGLHRIMIRPGIKLNGIAMSRAYYPFYKPYEGTVNLVPEQTDTIIPTATYYENKVKWKEDFESAGYTLLKFGVSDTNFVSTQEVNQVFEGFSSGIAKLDATYKYVLSVSERTFDIPQNQSPVFLELNYKTNVPLAIGMYAILTTGQNERLDALVINPNTNWNKIYINLTYTANSSSNTTGFRVFFEAYKPDSIPTAEILIDNVKLLYND